MLLELNIKNFAIIEKLNVSFKQGLNIITGETGTGKSILIEALGVLLGSRTNKDFIRTGEDKAILEGVFYIKESAVEKILKEYDIPLDEDKVLIINRTISKTGPSLSKVNGKNVNVTMLTNITKYLVDIFGQHEHQSLLHIGNHALLIDSFGDKAFIDLKKDIEVKYSNMVKKKQYLEKISIDSSQRDREIDILRYQINEIQEANIDLVIDGNIEEEFKKSSKTADISLIFSNVLKNLEESDFENINIIDIIRKDTLELEKIVGLDKEIQTIYDRFKSISFELEDLNRECVNYVGELDFDQGYVIQLEERLDLINKLKNKYGSSLEEILQFGYDADEKLYSLENQDNEMEKLKEEIEKMESELLLLCNLLTEKRKDIANKLEVKIQKELEYLNMEKIKFKVDFKDLNSFSQWGRDRIEFLIATNIGEGLKPLSRIASGGEMSRIMLAFKGILAEYDGIETMIFDEIDTGISGRTAQLVGEKIYEISKKHQVVCISHLPQITAMADNHYSINKETIGNKTGSYIKELTREERVEELARLIGGVDLTETTIKHAIEMIDMCERLKETK